MDTRKLPEPEDLSPDEPDWGEVLFESAEEPRRTRGPNPRTGKPTILDDRKHTCPDCHIVFHAPQTGGPVRCPVCNPPLPPAQPPAPAAPRRRLRRLVAAGALVLLGVGTTLALPQWIDLGRAPALAPDGTAPEGATPEPQEIAQAPPAADAEMPAPAQTEPAPEGDSPSEKSAPPAPLPREVPLPTPPAPPQPPPQPPRLPAPTNPTVAGPTQAEVDRAIERGVAFLRKHMEKVSLPVRYEGLVGLTLLECGVPAKDPLVQKIAASLRGQVHELNGTYEMSLSILFFDRLGGSADSGRIQALAEALAAGQREDGGWGYRCPRARAAGGPPRHPVAVRSDHSNTQFAVLALWVAGRHGSNTRAPLARAFRHYRETQQPDGGWSYRPDVPPSTLANTCSGLIALAAGHGINAKVGREARPLVGPRAENHPAVAGALACLAHFSFPALDRSGGPTEWVGLESSYDLYALWAVERMATLYDLKAIDGREWYPGFAHLLVGAQQADGRWHATRAAPVDTCFALLILRRGNLLPDLTATIQGKPPHLDFSTSTDPKGKLSPTGPAHAPRPQFGFSPSEFQEP
jgi:hypothetical protein